MAGDQDHAIDDILAGGDSGVLYPDIFNDIQINVYMPVSFIPLLLPVFIPVPVPVPITVPVPVPVAIPVPIPVPITPDAGQQRASNANGNNRGKFNPQVGKAGRLNLQNTGESDVFSSIAVPEPEPRPSTSGVSLSARRKRRRCHLDNVPAMGNTLQKAKGSTKISSTAPPVELDRQRVPSRKRDRNTGEPSECQSYIPAKRKFKTNRKPSEQS